MNPLEPLALGAECPGNVLLQRAEGKSRGAVLILPPLLDEGARAHWVLRQTAQSLATRGIDSLRIEFAGQGFASTSPPTLAGWQTAIRIGRAALAKLQPEAEHQGVVATRFSAGLAVAGQYWRRAAFWDPVWEGAAWVAALDQKRRLLDQRRAAQSKEATETPREELGGQVLSDALLQALAAFPQTPPVAAASSARAIVVNSRDSQMPPAPTSMTLRQIDAACDWTLPELPTIVEPAIVSALCEPWSNE